MRCHPTVAPPTKTRNGRGNRFLRKPALSLSSSSSKRTTKKIASHSYVRSSTVAWGRLHTSFIYPSHLLSQLSLRLLLLRMHGRLQSFRYHWISFLSPGEAVFHFAPLLRHPKARHLFFSTHQDSTRGGLDAGHGKRFTLDHHREDHIGF